MLLAAPAVPPVCIRGLPARAPAGLPAAVALDAGCALVVVEPDGRIVLRPRPHVTYPPGWQVAPGVGLTIRNRHVEVVDHGRVRWRSHGVFVAGKAHGIFTGLAGAAIGRGGVSFVVARTRLRPARTTTALFTATWARGERLVARGVDSDTLVATARGPIAQRRLGGGSVLVRRFAFDGTPSPPLRVAVPWLVWDGSRLLGVAAGRLVATDGVRVRTLALLARVGAPQGSQITPQPDGTLLLTAPHRVVTLDARGRLLSSGSLPRSLVVDTVLGVAPGGARVAFAAAPFAGGSERQVWALEPGARRAVRLGSFVRPPSCAGYGGSGFSGRFVLLQVPGGVVRAVDTGRPGRFVDLTPLAKALRARHRSGGAGWLSDWRRV